MRPGGTLIFRDGTDARRWAWAGYRANATLTATMASVIDPVRRPTELSVRSREGVAARLADFDGAATVLDEPVRAQTLQW